MKPIEDYLAAYLLALVRGPWSKDYNRRCLEMWRGRYGDQVANRVEQIVKGKWKG